jgi:hypothetical protein
LFFIFIIAFLFYFFIFYLLIPQFLVYVGSIIFPPLGFFLSIFPWDYWTAHEVGTHGAAHNPRERWIHVNGIGIDKGLGHVSVTHLSKLFQRKV